MGFPSWLNRITGKVRTEPVIATSAAPALTEGGTTSLSSDLSGNLRVGGAATQGTIPWVENLAQVGGSNVTLGQKAMASSIPVTLASDYVPFLQQDLIPTGVYPNRISFYIVGKNPVVNNTREDVIEFATNYVFPASPIQMQVVSSSANDSSAGTGIRTVFIHYLDNLYNTQTTIVTLNGITPVLTTPTNILRVNGMHAATVGSLGTSAGNISLQAVGGAITYSYIAASFNSSRSAVYTIPAGKTGYIISWDASSGATTGAHYTTITLDATCHDGVLYPGVFLLQDETATLNGAISNDLIIPIKIPATTDIKISAISDAANANAQVVARFDGWYE